MNDASSNCRRQPGMGTAFTAEWMASTWMSQCIERTRSAVECKQRHPMTMEHQRGGDLYFKSGKDACISSNLKKKKLFAHSFWIVTGKSLMRSSKMVEKERSIVVMIIKNRFWSWNKRTMGWTLPLGKSQRNEKINLAIRKPRVFNSCSQETPSFQTPWSGIIKKHQVFRPFFCHPLRASPGKSYFSYLSYHILSIWVGRPS